MTGTHWQNQVADDSGDVVASPTITVRDALTNALVNLWSNRAQTTTKTNPFTGDADGYFNFFVNPGVYKVTAVSGALTRTWDHISLSETMERPIGTAATTDIPDRGGADARYLQTGNNLSDLNSAATARSNLGLGTMAPLNSGTGSGDFRTNTQNDSRFLQLANNLSDLASASAARLNLGLGSASTVQFGGLTCTNLVVNGTTTTVNATNLLVDDPLALLGSGNATDAVDLGIICERNSNNVGLIWDESADEWCVIETTDDGTTSGNVSISNYTNWHCATLTADYIIGSVVDNVSAQEVLRFNGGSAGASGRLKIETDGSGSTPLITATLMNDSDLEIVDNAGSLLLGLYDGGQIRRSCEAGITASTTQTQGQQPLTKHTNEISTCANANDTVTAPAATAGAEFVVINNGANTLQVFPASGDDLGGGVDTAITISAGSAARYCAYDATNWLAV